MELVDGVKDEIPRTSQPFKHFYEKSLCKFVRSTVQKTTEANEEFNFVQFAIACPQFENIRRGLGKIRRKDTPVLPKTLVAIDLDGQYLTTIYLGRFLLFDTKYSDRIIAFASSNYFPKQLDGKKMVPLKQHQNYFLKYILFMVGTLTKFIHASLF